MKSEKLDDLLMLAIETNDYKAIPYLVKAGANPNAISYDREKTMLSQAITHEKIKCAETLLKLGADPNMVSGISASTPTHTLAFNIYAFGRVMKKSEKWIELFLDYGADFHKSAEKYSKMTPFEKLHGPAKKVYDRVVSTYVPKTPKLSKPKMK